MSKTNKAPGKMIPTKSRTRSLNNPTCVPFMVYDANDVTPSLMYLRRTIIFIGMASQVGMLCRIGRRRIMARVARKPPVFSGLWHGLGFRAHLMWITIMHPLQLLRESAEKTETVPSRSGTRWLGTVPVFCDSTGPCESSWSSCLCVPTVRRPCVVSRAVQIRWRGWLGEILAARAIS